MTAFRMHRIVLLCIIYPLWLPFVTLWFLGYLVCRVFTVICRVFS